MSAGRQVRGTPLAEVVAYGLLTALGALVFVTAFGYGIFDEKGRVEPGLLPMAAGGLLALLSAVELVARLRTGSATPHASPLTRLDSAPPASAPAEAAAGPTGVFPPGEERGEDDVDVLGRTPEQRVRNLWVVFAAVTVTVLLAPVLGFLVAFGLLVFLIATVVEGRRLVPSAIIAAVAIAAVYGIFAEFLSVPLPQGVLEGVL